VSRRSPLNAAAALSAAQGVALAGVCIAFLFEVVIGRPHDAGTALFGFGLGLIAAAVFIGLARPMLRGRRYARTPVVLLELLALPVGVDLLEVHRYGYGAAVCLPALLTLALLAAPSARRPFEGRL
jgi:ABC-type thiamin/hydroxymethylpyrimidine transport system permease subunit